MQPYCWGDVPCGHPGLGLVPGAGGSRSWSVPGPLTSVCCGESHTLVLRADGDVLSCGNNCQGQLGRMDADGKKLSAVEGLGKVVAIACGQDHSLALGASGQVFSWGAGQEGQRGLLPHALAACGLRPSLVPIPITMQIVQVACGDSHSLVLTKGGDVLSWGLNSHGQLGLGKEVLLQYEPELICSLTGVAVTQIAAGGSHSLFLTLPGLVYCCGANKSGQLGVNRVDEKGRFNVCMVPALRTLGVSSISCGEAHSAVLTKDGKVFTFGEGHYGQLGHNSSANEVLPKLVQGLDGAATQVACGRHHTLVLGSSGQLWAFGKASKGQLGNGTADRSLTPVPVQPPWTADGSAATPSDLKISAGWNSSFAFSSPSQGMDGGQTIGRLDEAKLQRWLTLRQGGVEAKKEIAAMFLTSSSLVASFTKPDGPPLESGALTVDLEAATRTFERMLAIPWIKQSVNMRIMINLLDASKTRLKCPEIIPLLLSCPLLLEDANVTNVVVPVAAAIDHLNDKNRSSLKSWWSSLPVSMLARHIAVFKQALAFMLVNGLLGTHDRPIRYLLDALKLLYKANKVGKSYKVPLNSFYVEEIRFVNPAEDFSLWCIFSTQEENEQTPAIFCRYPFLLPLVCKMAMFNICAAVTKNVHLMAHQMALAQPDLALENPTDSAPAPVFQLTLRRTHLVEDTFRQLEAAEDFALRRELLVQFKDDRKLMNVNKNDLFLHIFDELIGAKSELFMQNSDETLIWFPPKPKVEEKRYLLFGVLCGMALHNHNIIHLPFPLALFKKLLGVPPTLDDMVELEPSVAGVLRDILEEKTADSVETLDFTFALSWHGEDVELDPQEPGKSLTWSNRKEYVAAYVDYIFNKSVERAFQAFKRGFFKGCDVSVVEFFQPEELQLVMVGQEDADWEVFKQNTVYEGEYHAEHPNILIFWEVFDSLTEEEKKKFLLFLTGVPRVPILGMECIKMRVAVLPDATEIHMPESLTCHRLLLLPLYGRYPVDVTMRNRLLEAIHHNRGFWKEQNAAGTL
ncbi:unnamed protein product [Ophioblennius macclurei]